ncbi:MAG TPA: hypothetical protein VE420_09205, partial [Gemmatimonadales bacterium]|nr:hypothetical protein [Gemmatimonadales bacterium]
MMNHFGQKLRAAYHAIPSVVNGWFTLKPRQITLQGAKSQGRSLSDHPPVHASRLRAGPHNALP